MWSDLTLDTSFKVKRGWPNLSAYNTLTIGLKGLQCETNLYKIMGWECFDVVRFELGPLLQGQIKIAKLKSTYNSLIISPRLAM